MSEAAARAPTDTATSAAALERWLTFGLGAWAVGVQLAEPVASVGMVVCALSALWSARADPAQAVRTFLRAWWPLVLFIAWAAWVPVMFGHPPSGTGFARLLDWAGIPLAAWGFATIGGARTSRVLAVGAGVFLVSCAVAGLQHFGVWPSSDAMRALAFTKIPFDRVYEAVPGAEGRFMAGGLLFHRLKFAHVGGLAVVGLLAFALRSTGRTRARLLTAAALGMGAILMFPFARAASAALAGASLLVLVLASRRRRQALVLGSVLVVLGAAAVASQGPLRARFLSSFESDGNGDRTSLLKAGVSVVRAHPLSGVGAGRFKVRDWAPEQASDHVRSHPGMAHNQLLSMAAQVGVPGALLFLFLLAWLVRKLDATRPEGIASLGALAFFVLLSGVHDPLFHAPFSMALPLMLGLGAYRRA